MEIEEVAKKDPKSIIVESFEPDQGPTDEQLNRIIKALKLESESAQAKE